MSNFLNYVKNRRVNIYTAVLSYLQQLVNAMYSLLLDNVSLPQSPQCLESDFLGGRWLPSINFSIIPSPK